MNKEMDRVLATLDFLHENCGLDYDQVIETKVLLTNYLVLLYKTKMEKPNDTHYSTGH